MPHTENGLKSNVKAAIVRAFRAGLSDSFWSSLDESVQDIDPSSHVLAEFPVKKTTFPIVRLEASFGKVNWGNLNRFVHDTPSDPTMFKQGQLGKTDVSFTVDIYALSPSQRDRICDTYLKMILFAFVYPKTSAFVDEFGKFDGMGIQPVLNSVSMGSDNAGTGIPWCKDEYVYMTSMSFDAVVTFAFTFEDEAGFIKTINVNATEK